jgi:serine/threonine protein kinase
MDVDAAVIFGAILLVAIFAFVIIWRWSARKQPSKPVVVPTQYERDASPTPSSAPLMSCVAGPYQGHNFPITSSEFSIGRSQDRSLPLEGTLVSRNHALIIAKDDQYLLYDQESTNGTYVNGRRVLQHVLQPGDQIRIGPFVFAFQVPGVTVSPAPVMQPIEQAPTPEPVSQRAVSFGDYEIAEVIGGGGMATVYRGISRRDGSTAAIKVFHQTDPYLKDKFEQEIRIGATLAPHPHIAQVYNGGSTGGVYFMIMEYVDNKSLRERLHAGRPMPFDQVVAIVGQTCDALDHAHRQGIYHRDIKPENILFSSQEGVKLVDFGIAKLATAVTHTMDGMIVGTPFYMSYEQAQGARVDPRSDLYSLGVVVYEMLTGRPPFTGEPLTVVHKHLTEQPVKPRQLNASIPSQAEKAVMRALDKDINKRFQSAEEMARALGYTASFYRPGAPAQIAVPYPSGVQQAGPPQPRATARLVVVSTGHTIPLSATTITIQRRDVNPDDQRISRQNHARITCRGQQYWLEDLGSTNGTYWGQQRIFEPVLLRSGDTIRLGHTHLRFES